ADGRTVHWRTGGQADGRTVAGPPDAPRFHRPTVRPSVRPPESPSHRPAAAAVPGMPAPVPARRSRQRLLHYVEDFFRHVALGKERQLDRGPALRDDRHAIRGNLESRAALERVVQDDEIEGLI